MNPDVLTRRACNRATLERQHLLRRVALPVPAAVEQLVGLQAQEPQNPYLALWSRLEGFDPADLSRRIEERELVRIVVMRSTVHLVTGDDALRLRPVMQPHIDTEIPRHRDHGPALAGVDLEPVLAFARDLLREPHSTRRLRQAIEARFPDLPAAALAYACRCHLPLVQVPPRGLWQRGGQVTYATAEAWLGRPVDTATTIDEVVLRYLAAFGPAAVADVGTWCRLTGLREVVERLRPRLRTFRDERGRELFDLPDAPRPDPDTPAPVRFLPEFDNVLLSHADRSRFLADDDRFPTLDERAFKGSVLHDGTMVAAWRGVTDRAAGTTTLVVTPVRRISTPVRDAIEAEARSAGDLLGPGLGPADLRFTEPG